MNTPTSISVVEFHTITGVPLTEHGVSADYLVALQEMFQDVRVVSTDACDCPCCWDERAKHAVHRYDPDRQKGDDDGVEYADPRDERDDRRTR